MITKKSMNYNARQVTKLLDMIEDIIEFKGYDHIMNKSIFEVRDNFEKEIKLDEW